MVIQLSTWMTWPSPSVCQSLDLEKETFRCDSCFPYKVHFLYIKDTWFAWPKYVQINLSLTSSLARPAQLSVVFEVNTIHQSNFQSTSLVSRKKEKIPGFTRWKNTKPLKNRLKTRSYTCRSLWTAGRRDSTVCTVSHFRSSSTKSSSWFLSSLISVSDHTCQFQHVYTPTG